MGLVCRLHGGIEGSVQAVSFPTDMHLKPPLPGPRFPLPVSKTPRVYGTWHWEGKPPLILVMWEERDVSRGFGTAV